MSDEVIQEAVQAPPVPEEKFDFVFTITEVNLLLEALGELPTKKGYNAVAKILQVVNQQQQARAAQVS